MAFSSVSPPAEHAVKAFLPETIQVKGLRKCYGEVEAVQGIDFTVSRGEIFGLIGPDGAGKSTVFQMLAGVMPVSVGEIKILGKVPQKARSHLGYLTQTFSLYADLSILENLKYVAGLRHVSSTDFDSRAKELLALMGLERFQHRLARQLSGGMKQKLALCCALISKPQILLLDEPTTGVDPISRREFWDLLAKIAADGVSVVAATPYLDEAERCHRIALMYAGKIQQMGTLVQLQNQLNLQRIEVYTPNLFAAEAALQEAAREYPAMLKDIQSFGDRLDVLTPNAEATRDLIAQSLSQKQLTLQSVELRPPTLENVFVNHLRQQDAALTYQPFPYYRPPRHPAKEIPSDAQSCQSQTAISAHRLQKVFGTFPAVKDVSLTIQYGEIYGLLGANGAGKTTVIKMLCGLLPITRGEMTLAGECHNLHRPELRSRLGYMSQKFTLYDDLTIRQNLEFYCGVYGIPRRLQKEKINWVLTTCGLVGQESTLTKRLPGGWKQRVAFGASVIHEPDILFLDEPTSGVDPLARRQFWKLIRDFAHKGTAILVTTHYLEEAENCNRLAFMVAGEIVIQGTPNEIKHKQPGQLFELETNQTQQAAYLLKQQLAPWRVSIFGNQLHLVLEHPKQELPALRQALQSAQIKILRQRPIPFTLEDAFIGTARRVRKGE